MTSPKLSESISLRGLTVRNRIWVSPMCQYHVRDEDGIPEMWHQVHYGGLANGGFGMVMAEATGVVPEGRISPRCTGIWLDAHTEAWRPIVSFVHEQGASMGIQLNHAGRKASTVPMLPNMNARGTVPPEQGGWVAAGPSPIAARGQAEPRAMSTNEVRALPGQFAAAAQRAVDAGFDTVEVHAAHGYLLHQFLSPLSNTRDDDYGGSFANRTRLTREVVQAVRDTIPEQMPLLLRISATDWAEGGWALEETVELAAQLRDLGVDLIDVSTGGNVHAQIPVGPAYQVPFASAVRKAGIPTGAVGMITDAQQAEQVLVDEHADVVLLGREALRMPTWPIHALKDLGAERDALPFPDSYFRAW
ncbi:NADH:flavin oxidoreductase/NADH oxidase [Corynebacterium lubricantis]|uniref:NADH:flavin oxidoreductase/NADH oxidase n=1 Tax=Corynebacterium lubricantis TaxID=541095 RepID=UPI000367D920|nr:NADH:flavin oxidoreductase/NADH oxidase [Corynebacterium lubricantis]